VPVPVDASLLGPGGVVFEVVEPVAVGSPVEVPVEVPVEPSSSPTRPGLDRARENVEPRR